MNTLARPEQQPRNGRRIAAGVALAGLLIGIHVSMDRGSSKPVRVTVREVLKVAPQLLKLQSNHSLPMPVRHPSSVVVPKHRPRNNNERFVAKYIAAATQVYEEYQVPIDLTLAQASHESDYGRSKLSRDGHGFFGIKASTFGFDTWHGPVYHSPTTEVLPPEQLPRSGVLQETLRSDGRYNVVVNDNFRQYSSDTESFLDYGYYLRHRGFVTDGDCYADARGLTDPIAYLRAIETDSDGPAGPEKVYASDPQYIQKVSARIAEMHLAREALGLA